MSREKTGQIITWFPYPEIKPKHNRRYIVWERVIENWQEAFFNTDTGRWYSYNEDRVLNLVTYWTTVFNPLVTKIEED